MIKFHTIKVGDTLYTRFRRKMGNTSSSETCEFAVKVLEINTEEQRVLVSVNNNPSTWRSKASVEQFYRNKMKQKVNPYE